MGNFADWWIEYVEAHRAQGVRITPDTALMYSSVWQGVNTIAGDIASPPFYCYDVENDGDLVINKRDPSYYLLNVEPNELMSAYTFRQILQAHALIWGNGMAAIQRDDRMVPRRLIPLLPDRTEIILENGQLFYVVNRGLEDEMTLRSENVFHVVGLSFDGFEGYPLWKYGRESLGLGLESERHSTRTLQNNSVPPVVLKHPAMLSEEEADQLLETWQKRQGGDNKGRAALAAGGLEVTALSHTNEQNQHIEQRKFQRVEVASWLNLPPHKLNDDQNASYNSLENQERAYLNQTLRRWFSTWEAEAQRKLMRERDKRSARKIFKHDTTMLVETDMSTKTTQWTSLVSAEIATRNEARRRFGLPLSEDPAADELRNPNTRTDESGGGEESTETDNEAVEAHRRLIASALTDLVTVDVEKLQRAAKRTKNFVSWLDSHYSKTVDIFDKKLAPIYDCYNVVAGTELAPPSAEYAENSKNTILAIAGAAIGQDDLHSQVTTETAGWTNNLDAYLPELSHG